MSKMIIDFKGKVIADTAMVDFLRSFTPVKMRDDKYIPEYDREFDVKIVTEASVKMSRTEQLKEVEEQLAKEQRRGSEEFNRRYKAEQKVKELEAKLASLVVAK